MFSGLLPHIARIALVDDDRYILASVKMTLEGEVFEIDTYSDGQSALEAFYRKQPDIVVVDIKMPRMDGMDLLQKMRPKISSPVIFLTSKDDEIDEVLGLRMGADDYIKNPFLNVFWSLVFGRYYAVRRSFLTALWYVKKGGIC